MTLDRDLRLVCDLVHEAGLAILEARTAARASPRVKSDDSPVTEADLAADAVLRAGLCGLGDLVVTEETWSGGPVPPDGRVWFIDPIDGTEDFIAGRPDFVVQAGLCIDGAPVLGAIHQPATGALWRGLVPERYCDKSGGASPGQRKLSDDRELSHAPRVAVSISHPSSLVDYVVSELKGTIIPTGSVGLKIGRIVDGEADAYVTGSRRIKYWDTAGPAAVLLAAGGAVSSLSLNTLSYRGDVAHDDGFVAWSEPARRSFTPALRAALARFRETPAADSTRS